MTYIRLSHGPRRKLRIGILDDHPIVVQGVASFLRSRSEVEVVFAVETTEALLAALRTQACDVAVIDYHLPDGQEDGVRLLKRLHRLYPQLATVTFSAAQAASSELMAYRAGGNAFVSKTAPLSLLAQTIVAVGEAPRQFFAIRGTQVEPLIPSAAQDALTLAEREVLRQLAKGYSVTQVAAQLQRSKKTVSSHKRRAMVKLALADDLALAWYLKAQHGVFAWPDEDCA